MKKSMLWRERKTQRQIGWEEVSNFYRRSFYGIDGLPYQSLLRIKAFVNLRPALGHANRSLFHKSEGKNYLSGVVI
jgi:hypothetical protein